MHRLKAWLDTLSTVLVIVVAGVLLYQHVGRTDAAPPERIVDATGTISKAHLTNQTGTGNLAIVEFSDFECPFCARHAKETLPALQRLDGVRYVSIHLPLGMHKVAIPAAEAAECAAEQGKFWEMRTALFDNARFLQTAVGNGFEQYVLKLGLDAPRFTACRTAGQALARVTADQQEAARLGVRSTPTLFIGRMRSDGGVDLVKRLNGALPADLFAAEVAKLTKG